MAVPEREPAERALAARYARLEQAERRVAAREAELRCRRPWQAPCWRAALAPLRPLQVLFGAWLLLGAPLLGGTVLLLSALASGFLLAAGGLARLAGPPAPPPAIPPADGSAVTRAAARVIGSRRARPRTCQE
jgi:hypothetical protein